MPTPGFLFGARCYDRGKELGCPWYNTQTRQIGGAWGPTGQAVVPQTFLTNHAYISGSGAVRKDRGGPQGLLCLGCDDAQWTYYDHGSPSCAGYGSLGCDTQINAPGVTDERNTCRRTLNHLSNITKLVNPLPPPNLWRMEKHFAMERRMPQ